MGTLALAAFGCAGNRGGGREGDQAAQGGMFRRIPTDDGGLDEGSVSQLYADREATKELASEAGAKELAALGVRLDTPPDNKRASDKIVYKTEGVGVNATKGFNPETLEDVTACSEGCVVRLFERVLDQFNGVTWERVFNVAIHAQERVNDKNIKVRVKSEPAEVGHD